MYFMAVTFEKPGANVIESIWSSKNYFHLADCFLYDGNPYIEGIHEFLSDDLSYAEYIIPFHDKNFYELWFDEFKDIYLPYRQASFDEFRSKGIVINDYIQSFDVGGTDGMKLLTEFVSKFSDVTEKFKLQSV